MIKNRLKVVLAERDMSVSELARQLGRSRTTIVRFMSEDRKTINVPVLDDICDLLGVQPGDIYYYERTPVIKFPRRKLKR